MKSSGNNEAFRGTGGGLPDSFTNAFAGIAALVKSEKNARIHFVILALVVIAGIVLKISPSDWIAVTLASGLVVTAECINTAIECLCDSIKPGYDTVVKKVKDLAAAGVLFSAIASVVTGLIVFVPALLRIFN